MTHKIYGILAVGFSLSLACRELPAAEPATPAKKATIASGIYMGKQVGDCLCVNAEKQIAGKTNTLAAMSINLGKSYDEAESEDMKGALKEAYTALQPAGKNRLKDGDTIYVKVAKAKKCDGLNEPMKKPIAYSYCLE